MRSIQQKCQMSADKYSDFEGRLLGEWDVKQGDESS